MVTAGRIAVFDLDNTLIDSKAKLQKDVVDAMMRLGIEISQEESSLNWEKLSRSYGVRIEDFYQEFEKRKTWQKSLRDGEVQIFPETRFCLEELASSQVRMGILSRSIPKYTLEKLQYFDIRDFFDYVETVHPKEESKLRGALEITRRSYQPGITKKAFFIGDKEEDVSIAQGVGEEFKLESSGIYINRNSQGLEGYPLARDIREANRIILKNGR